MKNRLLAAVFAVFLPITLLCGCSVERLTLDEYKTELDAAFKGWTGAVLEWADFSSKNVFKDPENPDFDELCKNRAGLEQKILQVESAIDEFDKLGNPPEEYDELHQKLKNGVSIEREWLKIQRGINESQTKEEYLAKLKSAETFFDKYDSSFENPVTLPMVYAAIVIKQKSAESDRSRAVSQ
ncbi:MAG: hypothetical protein ACI4JT_08195 [Oscillospiraceae bacterium]